MRGFHTLAEQITSLREFSNNPQQRVRTGLASIDIMCEGPASGEVFTFLGRSFSGKSNVGVNLMVNNPTLPLILFSLEMPARQVLQRLYSTWSNVSNYDVQRQTKAGSLPHILDTMADELPKQVVVDRPGLSLGDMSAILEQYDEYYGERPAAVVIDYLELVQGGNGEGHFRTEQIAKALKDWAKSEVMAVFLLHQTNRTEKVWDPPTEDSARGAGYTESDVVVGMWQPGRDPNMGDIERRSLDNQIYMNVLKNRITGRTTSGRPLKMQLEPTLKIVDLSAHEVKRWYTK